MNKAPLKKIISIIFIVLALAGAAWLFAYLGKTWKEPAGSVPTISLPADTPSFIGIVQQVGDGFFYLKDSRISEPSLVSRVGLRRIEWDARTLFLKSIPETPVAGQAVGLEPGKGRVIAASAATSGASVLVYGAPAAGAQAFLAHTVVINP